MQLRRVAAIDDQERGVAMLSDRIVEYLEAEPIPFDRRPASARSVVDWVAEQRIDAVLIDEDLRKGNYGVDQGIVIAAELFRARTPTVLTTMHRMSDINDAVWHRRYVPAHVSKGHLERVEEQMRKAIDEINGRIAPERRPYRTVVRVDEVDGKDTNLVIPGYDPNEWITVLTSTLTKYLKCPPEVGSRFLAEVNIGAASQDELFISEVQS